MSGFDHLLWLEVYDYCYSTAARAFPHDESGAHEIASDCFDRFVRLYSHTGLENWKAWVGRSIAGLRKNYLRRMFQCGLTGNEAEEALERIRPPQPMQDTLYDVKRWRERIEGLEDRQRDAFRVIAEGGTVRDVMEELGIGPSEALAIINEARRQLRDAA